MKNLFTNKSILAAGALSLFAFSALAAGHGPYSLLDNHRFNKPMFSAMTMPNYQYNTLWGVKNYDVKDVATRAENPEPIGSFNDLPDYMEISTPQGTMFVTSSYEYQDIVHNEYWTESVLKGFEFTFYDKDFNKVATLSDEIEVDPEKGESVPAHCLLNPYVTTNFFNDDDSPEIMVYIGIKTGPEQDYHPNFYEIAYSLGGEKDADGYDVPLYTFTGRCVDMASDSEGNHYLSLVNDIFYSAEDYPDPVDRANATTTKVDVYGKGADGNPALIYTRNIQMAAYPGDTTESMYIITKNEGGVPYYVFSNYEKPYFVNPLGGASDESATPDNTFVIEVVKLADGSMQPVSETRIPVDIPIKEDKLMYAFYSIGGLTGKQDVDMSVNGTPEAPAFIVRHDITEAADLESSNSSYDIYSADGKIIRNLTTNAENFMPLSSAGSSQPHVMFISQDSKGNYTFEFIDLYSGDKVMSLPQQFEGESLTTTCDRIKGEDGKYHYAFVTQTDDLDDDGNFYKKIVWVNQDASLDRIDRMNMGKDVQASFVNLYGAVMDPYLFDNDDAMEYAILVKRTYGETVRNEFIVADDSGEWYVHFTEDDGRGEPYLFTVIPGADGGRLYMSYMNGNIMNVDVYSLPFDTLGVESIFDDNRFEASYENGEFIAPGSAIAIFTIDGKKVASARGNLSIENLKKGVYVAVFTDANGKTVSKKFVK